MEHTIIPHKKGFYEKYIKRPQDIVLSLIAMIILSPVVLGVAILVRFKLGSPVIFRQERPGLNGKIFTLHKFRTMTEVEDPEGYLLPDEIRLTSLGKLLRRISLDGKSCPREILEKLAEYNAKGRPIWKPMNLSYNCICYQRRQWQSKNK